MERLLDALMASRVRQEEHLVAQVPMVRHEDTGAVEQEPVDEAPRCLKLAGAVLSQQLLAVVRGLLQIGRASCRERVSLTV